MQWTRGVRPFVPEGYGYTSLSLKLATQLLHEGWIEV